MIILNEVALKGEPQTIQIFSWIISGGFEVDWSLRFDTLTAVMLVVVTVVSCAVHFYSIGYMHHGKDNMSKYFPYTQAQGLR